MLHYIDNFGLVISLEIIYTKMIYIAWDSEEKKKYECNKRMIYDIFATKELSQKLKERDHQSHGEH